MAATEIELCSDYARTMSPVRAVERRLAIWLFVASASVMLVLHNGGLSGLDGETYYQAARSFVDQGRLDVGPGFNSTTGVGGREYAKSNLGLPLLAGVIYFLSAPLGRMSPEHAYFIRTALVGASMTFVSAAIISAVYLLARRLGALPSSALIVGIGAVAGTFLLPYSKEFFPEPLSALGFVIAAERALAGRPTAAGAGLALAVLARPQSLLLVPVFLLVIFSREGIGAAVRAAGPLGASVVLTAAYNVARFGDPLMFGYPDEGFTMPLLDGARILLLDPSKSLLLFAPIAALFPSGFVRLWHKDRFALVLIASSFVATFVVAAVWHNPNGGWCWGPRLLIPGVVPSIAALGPWVDKPRNRRLAIGLFVLGFAVSVPAMVISTQIQQLDVPPPAGGVWLADAGLPTIVRQAEIVPQTIRYTFRHLYERNEDGRNYLRYLTFWQFGLARVFGRSGLLAAMAVSVVLILIAAWAATRCRLTYGALGRHN